MNMETTVLTIAGSDSCAGAGMQIDLKTAAAHGVYATCAVTALTAQNTREVRTIQLADPDVLAAQIEAVFDDIPPAAIKIGMLGSAELARIVARELRRHSDVPVVLDPVLVATAGAELTGASTYDVLRDELTPLATVVTPNLPEAAALTGADVTNPQGVEEAALAFLERGAKAVLVKGGHGSDETIVDSLYVAGHPDAAYYEFTSKRLDGEFHGTGCSISTAIACNIAKGMDVPAAVRAAHAYLASALANETGLGHGSKIINPFPLSPHTDK